MTRPTVTPLSGNGNIDFPPNLMASLNDNFAEMAALFPVPMKGQPDPLRTVTAFIHLYVGSQGTDFAKLRRDVLTASTNHSQASDALDAFMRLVRPLLGQGIHRTALAQRLSGWFMEVSRRPVIDHVSAASPKTPISPATHAAVMAQLGEYWQGQIDDGRSDSIGSPRHLDA